MEELADLSAVELGAAFASRDLSPVQVIDAVLARADRLEPAIHATYAYDPAGARKSAVESERRWRSGTAFGPLDGVPVTIKENIATRGVPRPMGTAATQLLPEPTDAPLAARLREAGAVIFAKTTMPDYAMVSSGVSSFHALSRNPWDLSRTPGGSSGGAAAAAAAGYGPLHVGTDIGGSIRLPSGWCGVVGLKPSQGRVPVDPPYMGRVAGPMTRTVTDAALMMSVMSLPDERDFMSLPPADIPWLDLTLEVSGLKIGLMLDAGCGMKTEEGIVTAVERAARLFESAGAVVEPLAPFMTPELLDGFDQFFRTRFWAETKDLPRDRYNKILPYIREWVEGARTYDFLTAYQGFSKLIRIREVGAAAIRNYDFIISPVAPIAAFAAELASPDDDPSRPFLHIGFTMAYNMTEQPACSINCEYTGGGLPIGLQIIGKRFDDIGVLRLARWYEQARGTQRPWPLANADT